MTPAAKKVVQLDDCTSPNKLINPRTVSTEEYQASKKYQGQKEMEDLADQWLPKDAVKWTLVYYRCPSP